MSTSLRFLTGRLRRPLRQLRTSETGQGLTEYALIIAIVSLGAIASLTFLKGSITGLFSKAGNSISLVAVGGGGGGGGGGTPPPNGTPINSGTPGSGGLPAPGGTGNDIPVWNGNPGDGPAGFQNAPGVFWGDPGDPPPTTYPVTVTELGRDITVNGCAFTVSGYQFYGVWIREPSQTSANDWTFGTPPLDYEWACINAPAFAVVDATHFTSNFAGPANGTDLTGQLLTSGSGNDTNPWFSEDTNSNAPANTNEPGIFDNNSPGGSSTLYNYFRSNGTVWLCHWYGTTSYTFAGGFSGQDNGCLATSPPGPPSGGSVTISNLGGGGNPANDDGDTLHAATSGWSINGSPITSYTYTWQRSDNFSNGTPATCSNNALGTVQGPTSNASTTNDYTTPDQASGTADSIWVTVTATNGNGPSTSVTDCVVVYNDSAASYTANSGSVSCPGGGGNCDDGENATVDEGTWGGAPLSFTYTWWWHETAGTACNTTNTGWTQLSSTTNQSGNLPTSGSSDSDIVKVIVTGSTGTGASVSVPLCRTWS